MKHEDTVKLIGLIVVAYRTLTSSRMKPHPDTVALWDLMLRMMTRPGVYGG